MSVDPDYPSGCKGKKAYASPQAAYRAIKPAGWKANYETYHCTFCGAWHLSHRSRSGYRRRKVAEVRAAENNRDGHFDVD